MIFNRTIAQLRYNCRLSQESFSDRLGVTRRTVQNWESGAAVPDANTLVTISKEFGISLDALLNDYNPRVVDEHMRTLFPGRKRVYTERYESGILYEYEQCIGEGLDVARYHGLFEEISRMPDNIYKKNMADILFDIVLNAPTVENYRYIEPSELAAIRELRIRRDMASDEPVESAMADKLRGAWLGRICGCLLGKPVEGMRTNELIPFLKGSGNYPMHRYLLSADVTDEARKKYRYSFWSTAWADKLAAMPYDDDTNYTVLASLLIDKYGIGFTPENVSELWMESQPKCSYATSEKVSLINYINGYCPPDTAVYKNPYREWIGAQICGDYFGYINPGDPEFAAELAWRDASVSHVKNGIYGEMFVAATLACAAVCGSAREAVEGGLAQIPSSSRLYEEIVNVLGCMTMASE